MPVDTSVVIVRDGVATAADAAEYGSRRGDPHPAGRGRTPSRPLGEASSGLAMVEARPGRGGEAIVMVPPPFSSVDPAARACDLAHTARARDRARRGRFRRCLVLSRLIARPLTQTAEPRPAASPPVSAVRHTRPRIHDRGGRGDCRARADAALVTSEGRQREFLLSISHDLRTPTHRRPWLR